MTALKGVFFLALATGLLGGEITNKGLLLPCMIYLPESNKYFFLYPMQSQEARLKNLPTESGEFLQLTINFCQQIDNSNSKDILKASIGSIQVSNASITHTRNYAISYYDSFLNATDWVASEMLDDNGDFIGMILESKNTYQSTSLVDCSIKMYCNPAKTNDAYIDTISIQNWTPDDVISNPRLELRLESAYACGKEVPTVVNTIAGSHPIKLTMLLFLGIVLYVVGYKALNYLLSPACFFFGISISAVIILQESNLNVWRWGSWTIFGIFALVIGLSLGYSSWYFPSGPLYLFAIVGGAVAASTISSILELQDRLYIGHLLLLGSLPVLLLYFFHKKSLYFRMFFTSVIAGVLLVTAIARICNCVIGTSLMDYFQLMELIEKEPLLIGLFLMLITSSCLVQIRVHRKYDSQNVELATRQGHIREILAQQ